MEEKEAKMKLIESDNFHVINEPLNTFDVISKKTILEAEEEPLFICNISDIIEKHNIWKYNMPRVIPFYGK